MTTVYDTASLAYDTDTNIRLIELLAETAWYDGERFDVNCKFHVVPLTSRPAYTAISYMWGEDAETADIILNGRIFAVRVNLCKLLEQLVEEKRSLLWVDAICIDQGNLRERNHQVGLMGIIYSQANTVVVWLGNKNEKITEAIKKSQPSPQPGDDEDHENDLGIEEDGGWENLSTDESRKRILKASERGVRRLSSTPSSARPYKLELDNALRKLQPVKKRRLQSRRVLGELGELGEPVHAGYTDGAILFELSALCKDPYWSRAWIVQEIILARRVQIQSSNARFEINTLDDQLEQIREWAKYQKGRRVPNIVVTILNSPASKLLAKRKKWQDSNGRSHINPWDSGFGMLGCSDVRDRVYAMAALMDPKIVITPDYDKTSSDVFKDIFEQHLQRTGTFSGTVWNLQTMLELGDNDPIVQRAKDFGSFEWAPLGTLAASSHRASTRSSQD